jgi:hypothetical protein
MTPHLKGVSYEVGVIRCCSPSELSADVGRHPFLPVLTGPSGFAMLRGNLSPREQVTLVTQTWVLHPRILDHLLRSRAEKAAMLTHTPEWKALLLNQCEEKCRIVLDSSVRFVVQ